MVLHLSAPLSLALEREKPLLFSISDLCRSQAQDPEVTLGNESYEYNLVLD
jgi:hypothetical protein